MSTNLSELSLPTESSQVGVLKLPVLSDPPVRVKSNNAFKKRKTSYVPAHACAPTVDHMQDIVDMIGEASKLLERHDQYIACHRINMILYKALFRAEEYLVKLEGL